jgi:hypothetical protein
MNLFDTTNTHVAQFKASLIAQGKGFLIRPLDNLLPDDVLGLIGSKVVETIHWPQVVEEAKDDVLRAIARHNKATLQLLGRTWTIKVQHIWGGAKRGAVVRVSSGDSSLEWFAQQVIGYNLAEGRVMPMMQGRLDIRRVKGSIVQAMIDIMGWVITDVMTVPFEEVWEATKVVKR